MSAHETIELAAPLEYRVSGRRKGTRTDNVWTVRERLPVHVPIVDRNAVEGTFGTASIVDGRCYFPCTAPGHVLTLGFYETHLGDCIGKPHIAARLSPFRSPWLSETYLPKWASSSFVADVNDVRDIQVSTRGEEIAGTIRTATRMMVIGDVVHTSAYGIALENDGNLFKARTIRRSPAPQQASKPGQLCRPDQFGRLMEFLEIDDRSSDEAMELVQRAEELKEAVVFDFPAFELGLVEATETFRDFVSRAFRGPAFGGGLFERPDSTDELDDLVLRSRIAARRLLDEVDREEDTSEACEELLSVTNSMREVVNDVSRTTRFALPPLPDFVDENLQHLQCRWQSIEIPERRAKIIPVEDFEALAPAGFAR